MKRSILAFVLAFIMVLSTAATPVQAAKKEKKSTKTITFETYDSDDKLFDGFPATVKISNVTKQVTKDEFSTYLSDKDITLSGKDCKVIYAKAPVTITLQPNKGEKHTKVTEFALGFDFSKIKQSTVKTNFKYYAFDAGVYDFDFSKKLKSEPEGFYGYAEGSTQKITKAGTYVLYIRLLNAMDDSEVPPTPVFIVVKK